MKKIISVLLIVIMAAALCISCGNEDYSDVENPVATIVVKDYGTNNSGTLPEHCAEYG